MGARAALPRVNGGQQAATMLLARSIGGITSSSGQASTADAHQRASLSPYAWATAAFALVGAGAYFSQGSTRLEAAVAPKGAQVCSSSPRAHLLRVALIARDAGRVTRFICSEERVS